MKGLDRTTSFQTLGFENINGCFSSENIYHYRKIEKIISYKIKELKYNIC